MKLTRKKVTKPSTWLDGVVSATFSEAGVSRVRFLVYAIMPILAGFITYTALGTLFFNPINPDDTTPQSIEIMKDSTLKRISIELQQRGFIKYSWPLNYAGRVSGKDRKIVAGEYEIRRSMSPTQLLEAITSGKPIERKVVVKEGVSIADIGKIVEDAGLLKKGSIDQALLDPSLIKASGSYNGQLEGYLFPETYIFSRPVSAKDIVTRMLKMGFERWSQAFSDRAEQLGMTRHQVLTLASIIEKESGVAEEQPRIASVFHNRLERGMPLQSDPTVIYGLRGNFDGNLTRAHLEMPTPYNTYVISGLPPGPIGNPGDSAIKAALYPEKTDYLFFVADGAGRHVFSATLEEHNSAVARYQLAVKREPDTNLSAHIGGSGGGLEKPSSKPSHYEEIDPLMIPPLNAP
jgi:UPF0755 protein